MVAKQIKIRKAFTFSVLIKAVLGKIRWQAVL